MITIKSDREIELMKHAGHINYLTHKEVAKNIKPGISTKALNDTEAVFTGVTGSFSMKEDHTPEKAIKVVELKDGVQVAAYTVD